MLSEIVNYSSISQIILFLFSFANLKLTLQLLGIENFVLSIYLSIFKFNYAVFNYIWP